MSTTTILALAGLAVAAFAAIWPILPWRESRRAERQKRADDARKKQRDDVGDLIDDQRRWYERMSEANRELLERIDQIEKDRLADRQRMLDLERGRLADRQLVMGLRDYVRRLIAANPGINIPPPPPELGIDLS